jgi:DNA polymerase-3 subunit delta'
MHWNDIVGHAKNIDYLREVIASGRIASAFLFCGPEGVGKQAVARVFAQTLLCEQRPASSTEPCGACTACVQVAAETHPDLIVIRRPSDRAVIPIESFVGVDGKMRDGLCHDLSLKPFRGGRKVAIVDDADFINQEGANSLLKTLEEPPPRSVLILIGTSQARQLPTIRSRCQSVLFQPLRAVEVCEVLQRSAAIEDAATAHRLAQAAGGSVKQAMVLSDPAVFEFRCAWLSQLGSNDPSREDFVKTFGAFVDQAGTDGAAKRDRMRIACEWALQFYEQGLHAASGEAHEELDAPATTAVHQLLENPTAGPGAIARCLERCLDAHADVGLNLNQALWIDCLLTDLSKLTLGEFVDARYV